MIGREQAGGTEPWLYPLRFGDTLTSNDWIEWPFHDFLDSPFVAHVLYEGARDAGFAAVLLFNAAFRQDPAGTLPDDDVQLARLAGYGVDVDGWRALRARALWGWSPVLVAAPDGDPVAGRLGHVEVAVIAAKSARRRDGRKAGREAAALAVDKSRVRKKLMEMKRKSFAENDRLVGEVVAFLRDGGLFITSDNVASALASLHGIPRVVSLGGDG